MALRARAADDRPLPRADRRPLRARDRSRASDARRVAAGRRRRRGDRAVRRARRGRAQRRAGTGPRVVRLLDERGRPAPPRHAFQNLGAEIEANRRFTMRTTGLVGADIFLSEMSVMATENAVMAATLATWHDRAAQRGFGATRPRSLPPCSSRWARASMASARIRSPSKASSGCTVRRCAVGPDYLEVGSFIALAALGGGEVVDPRRAARRAPHDRGGIWASSAVHWGSPRRRHSLYRGTRSSSAAKACTARSHASHDAPWPGFPADLTSIALVLATQAHGSMPDPRETGCSSGWPSRPASTSSWRSSRGRPRPR